CHNDWRCHQAVGFQALSAAPSFRLWFWFSPTSSPVTPNWSRSPSLSLTAPGNRRQRRLLVVVQVLAITRAVKGGTATCCVYKSVHNLYIRLLINVAQMFAPPKMVSHWRLK